MFLIKISQYKNDALPSALKAKLAELTSSSNPLQDQIAARNKQNPDFYFTVSGKNQVYGFAELSIQNKLATLHNIIIDEPYRGKKIGNKFVHHLMVTSVKSGAEIIQLSCAQQAIGFFTGAGFIVVEEPQSESKQLEYLLEHPCPEYYLSLLKKSPRLNVSKQTRPSTSLVLAQDSEIHNYSSEKQYQALHRSMIGQARKKIWIMCDAITAPILNNEYIRQAMFRLVRRNSQTEIKIMVANDKKGAGYYNQTIELAQRLSSYIEIRTLTNSKVKLNESLTLIDHTACIYRKNQSSHNGFASYHNRILAQRLEFNFDRHWQLAKPSLELRKLAI